MEIEVAATLLVGMLSKRGTDATAKQLMKLMKLGQRWGHFADTPLLFSVSERQELEETMCERTITGEEKEEKEIKAVRELWRTVLQTLKAMKVEQEVARAAAQMLAPEPGKDHAPKPGTLARVFGLPAVRGMTGITCNTIAEIQASAERGSSLGTERGGPPEVAAREIKTPPPGSGEESGVEVRLSSGRREEWLLSGRGEERLVPPPEGEGEGVQLTTSTPPLYPPLPPSNEASPLPMPSDGSQSELQGKKACDILQSVLQSLQDMSLQFQRMSIIANSPHWENEASSLKCFAGPPAQITPAHWSGVIRDAILDGQWNVATIMRDTQALACPVVQVNGSQS